MRFEVEKDQLADAVGWISRSLPSRPIETQLLNFRIEVSDSIKLLASNHETTSEAVIPATSVSAPGVVLIPGRLLNEISTNLPNQNITFILEGSQVLVRCGKVEFKLPTSSPDEYRVAANLPRASGEVAGDVLATAIRQVAVAAGRDESLPKMIGIHIEFTKKSILMAATDKYRLAIKEFEWNGSKLEKDTDRFLKARTLEEAAKSFTGSTPVSISLTEDISDTPGEIRGERIVGFKTSNKTLITRLLDEKFQPFKHIIPTESSGSAVVEVAPFLNAIKRMALVADTNHQVRLTFVDGYLYLEGGGGEKGQAKEDLEIEFTGEPSGMMGLNPHYLMDGLNAVRTPFAHISLQAGRKPIVIRPYDEVKKEEVAHYQYLLMPMQLNR